MDRIREDFSDCNDNNKLIARKILDRYYLIIENEMNERNIVELDIHQIHRLIRVLEDFTE